MPSRRTTHRLTRAQA